MTWFSLLFGPEGWGGLLLKGAGVTIALAVVTVPFGFSAGLALAVLKLSSHKAVRAFCDAYTTFFRGIPDLLALFIVYFGFQALIDRLAIPLGIGHVEVDPFLAGVIALSVVMAAYSSEVTASSRLPSRNAWVPKRSASNGVGRARASGGMGTVANGAT